MDERVTGERRDTFPRLLLHHARARPDHPATREKDLGIWQTWTWRQVADEVRALACGLAAAGLQARHAPRDHRRQPPAALLVDDRGAGARRRSGADVPGRAGRGIRLRAERRGDRLRARRGPGAGRQAARGRGRRCPRSRTSTTTIRAACATTKASTSFERLQENGREFDRAHPGFFDARGRAGPARRRLGHALHVGHDRQAEGRAPDARRVHRRGARAAPSSTGCSRDDSVLSYLPMAWVGDHLFSFAQWLVVGFTINCPESGDTVMTDLREIGPTYYFAPPRVFENLLTQVMIRMEDAGAIKRWLFAHFTDVARRCGAEILDGKPVALGRPHPVRARQPARLRAAAQRARHEPHPRRVHGGRGDRAGPVPLLPLDRHQPEAALRLDRDLRLRLPAARRRRQVRHGRRAGARRRGEDRRQRRSAGARADAAEGVLQAARRDRRIDRRATATSTPATPASSTPTGTSRSSIARRTSASSRPARCSRPTTSRTSSSSFRTSRKRSRSATAATRCARSSTSTSARSATGPSGAASPYSGYTDLAAKPEVYELIRECVEKVNAELAGEPGLADSQVRRFLILHKELDPDDDELTRTRKVRRGFVAEKYARADRRAVRGTQRPAHRDAREVRGRPHRHRRRRPAHRGCEGAAGSDACAA